MRISKPSANRLAEYTRIVAIVVAVLSMLVNPRAFAQEVILQTEPDKRIELLTANCANIQSTISQLRTSDALLRVNIGQAYNGISAQLMSRLNSRLAINRIDSSEFTEITSRFEGERKQFSQNYSDYEGKLSSLAKADCRKNPVNYYAKLSSARDARMQLAVTTKTLEGIMGEYQVAVEKLLYGESDEIEETNGS